MNLSFWNKFLVSLIFAGLFLFAFTLPVSANSLVNDPNCESFDTAGQCIPPGFELAEFWIIKGLYAVWAFGGLTFLAGLIVIGFKWMTSGGEQQKLTEIKKQATYWAISIPVFFGGIPVIVFVMGLFEINTSNNCYANLIDNGLPTFQLVFPEACEDPGKPSCGVRPPADNLKSGERWVCDDSRGWRVVSN
jgi:hypothetical protein